MILHIFSQYNYRRICNGRQLVVSSQWCQIPLTSVTISTIYVHIKYGLFRTTMIRYFCVTILELLVGNYQHIMSRRDVMNYCPIKDSGKERLLNPGHVGNTVRLTASL